MRNTAEFALLIFFALLGKAATAQSCEEWTFSAEAEIPSVCSELFLTMRHDQLGRPYLYVAAKEGGLKIFDISAAASPILVRTLPVDSLAGLHLMNLFQQGHYLYLALGNHFGSGQTPGMAIVDVSEPARAGVTDIWQSELLGNGAGVVVAQGEYAFLGAMGQGVFLFDVSEKNRVKLLGNYLPTMDFPKPNPNAGERAKINARGMAVAGDWLYLCYDAGGVRTIDVSDKTSPVERARYSNSAFDRLPRAYNNIALDGQVAYVAFDYCGVEVLDLSRPDTITRLGWWNPWNCPSNNWFTSQGHTNELALDRECKKLFVSAAKTELYVLDVSDPGDPRTCASYGDAGNNRATWGVSIFGGQVFLSYVCSPLGIPFFSNWTGVTLLSYNRQCATSIDNPVSAIPLNVYPNPVKDRLSLDLRSGEIALPGAELVIYDLLMRVCLRMPVPPGTKTLSVDVSALPAGVYLAGIGRRRWSRFIKN